MMKRFLSTTSIFALCFAAFAQQLSAPPIRMGLWETTITEIQTLVYDAARPSHKQTLPPKTWQTRSCISPESWRKDYGQIPETPGCEDKNVRISSSGISFDRTCKTAGIAKIHSQLNYVSPEKMQRIVRIEMASSSGPHAIVNITDQTSDSVYIGPDCGRQKPGDTWPLYPSR